MINDLSVNEGNSGTTNATFTVTLTGAIGAVTRHVNYATERTHGEQRLRATNGIDLHPPSTKTPSPKPSPSGLGYYRSTKPFSSI
ncbi:MAG: hypothetical protein U0X75_05855 [Acidobacteriota bacterium]